MCKLLPVTTNTGKVVYVADIKKIVIQEIINLSGKCGILDYVILFGSSLEERCSDNSDIDIAFISDIGKEKMLKSRKLRELRLALYQYDQDYDFLYYKSLNDIKSTRHGVGKVIADYGKIIYERTTDYV